MRDRHTRKSTRKKGCKYKMNGDIDVPEVEDAEKELSKSSIEYMDMGNGDDQNLPYSMVMVNHEDGGIMSYATPGKGIQGDRY